MGYLKDHLEKLSSLVAIEDKASLRKAALSLGLTQPALTRQIQILESLLEKPLLDRTAKGTSLTSHGKLLSQFARELIQKTEALEESLVSDDTEENTLRIGTFDSLSIRLWPTLISQIRAQYSHMRLGVRTGDTDELIDWVKNGDIDCAMTILFPPYAKTLRTKTIFEDAYGFFCAPEFAGRPQSGFTVAAVSELPIALVQTARCKIGYTILEHLEDNGFRFKNVLPVTTFEAAANYAREEVSLAVLPYILAQPSLKKEKLVALPSKAFPSNQFGAHKMGLVCRDDTKKKKLLRELEELLARLLGEFQAEVSSGKPRKEVSRENT